MQGLNEPYKLVIEEKKSKCLNFSQTRCKDYTPSPALYQYAVDCQLCVFAGSGLWK